MPTDLTDIDEFTDPVEVPVDADPANAASVETPFQILANRSRNIVNRLGSIDGSGEWAYRDDSGGAIPKSRVLKIDGSFIPCVFNATTGAVEWGPSSIGGVTVGRVDNIDAYFLLHGILPDGVSITSVVVNVSPGAARATGSNRIQCQLRDESSTVASGTDDGTTNAQDVTLTPGSPLVVQKHIGNSAYLYFQAGNDGGSHNNDFIGVITINFTQPGPRF